ncbi:MAG: YhbY family RNA-binding protein [Candidatus Hodarchaeota archaeon]
MKNKSKEILSQAWQNASTLQLGKKGISSSFLEELESQLKHNTFIKIKILKNAPFDNRSEAFEKLQQRIALDIELVEKRGRTVLVTKRV